MPALLKRALELAGIAPGAIGDAADEDGAVRLALGWARAGDVLVLPLHSREGRGQALALFERLRRDGWKAGQPLRTRPDSRDTRRTCAHVRAGRRPVH